MKIAILDRDGTLNQIGEEGFIGSAEAWKAQRGALEAVARLNRAGWHVVVATNQPGLGRGDRKSTRLNSSHLVISYAVFCLKKKKKRPAGVADPIRLSVPLRCGMASHAILFLSQY